GAGRALPAAGAAPGSISACPLSPRSSSLPQTLGPSLLKSVAERWFYLQKTAFLRAGGGSQLPSSRAGR
ncbi:unnamed protein product, partial [Coccothraustes coccothraustes]